jgi:hypothetical protein
VIRLVAIDLDGTLVDTHGYECLIRKDSFGGEGGIRPPSRFQLRASRCGSRRRHHSTEEYVFRLFDLFAPARFVSSLVSDDLAVGFALVNAGLVLFGLWCYAARVRPSHSSGPVFA